ncbi:mandelate racemase/muconate lactonizing enzyme family protein [Pseudohoeflea coraliihabitans]|uniref:Mandelate racemase/muconate lactonizing enzyme family protein n=1 Tax=Pseudohoeflea coraliihabitans TaxID=2860393 RepID=A0ABS6WL18_9HYPH|nr:mandelate racemase/muconate lactonizing enzyme family protein [Pseudohoeflea sp. DP4N28-3]MBW3096632.1 mandelate racemase/muconate lactonizing enzyme family protein [Pseudohoeflea sp. DP4N28-3]
MTDQFNHSGLAADAQDVTLRLAAVEAYVFRVPIAEPVVTSFGEMRDRPAVFVRVTGSDGVAGWGEVWCNFPAVGAEHRARLIRSVLAPLLQRQEFSGPSEAFRSLTQQTRTLAIQSGEPGPIAQAIAGIDMALWDLVARRAGLPVYRMFRDEAVAAVPVYASGINARLPEVLAARKRDEGYRRFKLKVGFGRECDLENLKRMRATLGADTPIMIDANQAWTLETAVEMSEALSAYDPTWLEEPLRADVPMTAWQDMTKRSPVPVALGENLRGFEAFDRHITESGIRFVQPDLGKWGGFSGCVEVGQLARQANVVLCPHWLGGGIGLIASQHLLAAVGGGGVLEVDANPNPLRNELVKGFPALDQQGDMTLCAEAGLGVEPDLQALTPYAVAF